MSRVDSWTGDSFPLSDYIDVDRGVDTARLVADKSTSITVVRAGVAQSAQNVRIEALSRPREVQSAAGETAQADALIVGYRGHPTIADTDLQRGDRFAAAGVSYEIVAVLVGLSDSLQAYAVVRS